MNQTDVKLIDLGRYGIALAWLRPNQQPTIRALETIEKTGGIRTVKASPDLIERVMRVIRHT